MFASTFSRNVFRTALLATGAVMATTTLRPVVYASGSTEQKLDQILSVRLSFSLLLLLLLLMISLFIL